MPTIENTDCAISLQYASSSNFRGECTELSNESPSPRCGTFSEVELWQTVKLQTTSSSNGQGLPTTANTGRVVESNDTVQCVALPNPMCDQSSSSGQGQSMTDKHWLFGHPAR